jgi:HSP20 family protein
VGAVQELDSIERRMRRAFEEFGFAPAFVPAADVYETDGELVVEIEVPGYEEQELEIELSDHTLTVKGRPRSRARSRSASRRRDVGRGRIGPRPRRTRNPAQTNQ